MAEPRRCAKRSADGSGRCTLKSRHRGECVFASDEPTRTAEQVAATDPAYEIHDPGDGNHTPERFPTITTDRAGYEQLVADRDTWKERAQELEALEAQTARQRDGYAKRAVAAEAALADIATLARAAVARREGTQ